MKKFITTSILTIVLLVSINTTLSAQWQRTLLGVLIKGVVSGFGEELGADIYEGTFGMRSNSVYAMYPELAERFGDIEQDISLLESQMYEMNNRVNSLDVRLTKLEGDMPHGAFGLGYGLGEYGQQSYGEMNALAAIYFKSASIGLNLNVHTFSENLSRDLERQEVNFTNILSYARFGSEESPAFVHFGSISSSGFGNSFLFRNYSNDIIYNDRQIGMKAAVNATIVGVEMMASGFDANRLKAGRVYTKPFSLIKGSTSIVMSNIGYSYITDVKPNGEPLNMQAIDFQIPISVFTGGYDDRQYFLSLYGNYGTVNEGGNGMGVGAAFKLNKTVEYFGAFSVSGYFEFRSLNNNFITGYFNPFYELGRYDSNLSSLELLEDVSSDRKEQVIGVEASLGFLSVAGSFVKDISETPDDRNNYMHIQSAIGIPIPIGDNHFKIAASCSYDKRNFNSFQFSTDEIFNNDSFDSIFSLSGSVTLPVGNSGADIFGKYNYRDFFFLAEANTLSKVSNSTILLGLQYNWGEDY